MGNAADAMTSIFGALELLTNSAIGIKDTAVRKEVDQATADFTRKLTEVNLDLVGMQQQIMQLLQDKQSLNDEIQRLKNELEKKVSFQDTLAKYELVKCHRATVYQLIDNPTLMACPSCVVNFQRIHILQNFNVNHGTCFCLNCDKPYLIAAPKQLSPPRRRGPAGSPVSSKSSW